MSREYQALADECRRLSNKLVSLQQENTRLRDELAELLQRVAEDYAINDRLMAKHWKQDNLTCDFPEKE